MDNEFWKKSNFMKALWYHCDEHLGSLYFGAITHRDFLTVLLIVWVSHSSTGYKPGSEVSGL